ncbi:hypothetical protein [Streptomyces sp. NPDC086023]|uniref:hypothetical protein n=1 Tax=Streptomyces sp. NPDC086023 TaxID=3365746 RepID=UPI0037CDA2ED
MTQHRRALRWTAGAALALGALTPQPQAYAATASPSAVAAPADGELAGSAAGAGRARPGRVMEEPLPEVLLPAARPVPEAEAPKPQPPRPEPSEAGMVSALGADGNDRAADLAEHILPLGAGLTLMGLGLGFMGMRLRRD